MLVHNMYYISTCYIFISLSQFWPSTCTGTNLICVSTKETNRDLKFPSTGSFFFLRMYSLGRRGWSMRGGGVRGGEGGNCSLGRITSVKLGSHFRITVKQLQMTLVLTVNYEFTHITKHVAYSVVFLILHSFEMYVNMCIWQKICIKRDIYFYIHVSL